MGLIRPKRPIGPIIHLAVSMEFQLRYRAHAAMKIVKYPHPALRNAAKPVPEAPRSIPHMLDEKAAEHPDRADALVPR